MAELTGRTEAAILMCAAILAALALTGCGGDSGESTAGTRTTPASSPEPSLTAHALETSVAPNAVAFASRPETILRRSVERTLGKGAAIAIKPGSTDCRPAAATPSDTNAARYPFACIVSGIAAAGGVSTSFALGFVVFSVHGLCWKASNERIQVASGAPILLPRKQALRAANVISGCAHAAS